MIVVYLWEEIQFWDKYKSNAIDKESVSKEPLMRTPLPGLWSFLHNTPNFNGTKGGFINKVPH